MGGGTNDREDREFWNKSRHPKVAAGDLKKQLDATPAISRPELPESDEAFREQLRIREADYYFGRVEQHIHDSQVRVKEIEITHVRVLNQKRRSEKE